MKVILVFRDSRRKGKSIEGIFQHLLHYTSQEIELIKWEYNDDISLFKNLRSLRKLKGDIVHITGDIMYLSIFLLRRKVILTIHDIGRYKELHHIKKQIYKQWWIIWPARLATRIVVVSKYTRNDILKLMPGYTEKIKVIPNGIHPDFSPLPKAFNTARPRVLQVGTAAHKNLETMFKSLQGLSCTLSIIGQLTDEHKRQLSDLRITYENYVDLDMHALREQYETCDMVVFVSLHEGFGLPVIEAQAVGRPVITSRMASIPEVAGDGALFIENPLDENELRAAIDRLIHDAALRSTLIEAGWKNAQQYSYENMAKAYVKLYQEVGST